MTSGLRLKGKIAPYVKILQAIAHAHRLAIVYLLAHEPLRTRDLMQKIGLNQSLLVHHLDILKKEGWIRKQRAGKHMTYLLEKKMFTKLVRLLKDTPFGKSF